MYQKKSLILTVLVVIMTTHNLESSLLLLFGYSLGGLPPPALIEHLCSSVPMIFYKPCSGCHGLDISFHGLSFFFGDLMNEAHISTFRCLDLYSL